jgi:hypothetical protein
MAGMFLPDLDCHCRPPGPLHLFAPAGTTALSTSAGSLSSPVSPRVGDRASLVSFTLARRSVYYSMRKFTAIILGVSFVIGAAVFGNYFYRSRAQDNTIRVVGAATKRFESDVVKWRITVGRSTGLADASVGYADTRKAFDNLMAQLKASSINEKDISVQPINRNPVYDNNGNMTGYGFVQSVYVISSDLATIEKLALNPDEMFQKGVALQSSALEYYFSKLPDIKKELLAEATRDAKQRAVEIAKNSGSGIGSMRSARAGIFQITEPYSTEVSDYGIYNTSTRQKDVTVTVTAEFGVR